MALTIQLELQVIASLMVHVRSSIRSSRGTPYGSMEGMSQAGVCDEGRASFDPIERWFRELDQRPICRGAREWLLQVTGILRDEDDLWIQIADDSRWAGSVLLRVRATTSVEQAVRALKSCRTSSGYPKVIEPPATAH